MKWVVRVRPDGSVRTLWNDALALHTLGHVTTERASSVEFDVARQVWVARTPDGRELAASPVRADVIRREAEALMEAI